jgi:tetratricopeptide (TPR) repeat protein
VPESVDAPPAALVGVPSVALFASRARSRSPGFEVTASNASAVAQLCRRLDGLPLALELTAAWSQLLSPGQLLERLEDCMRVEVDGPLDLLEHQRTMRATVHWSYCLLSESQRALFRRLAVFAGGAPVEAIEIVCQAAGPIGGSVLSSLNGLVEQSLARREGGEGDLRMSMLDVIRSFARERLAAAGEAEVTSRAHAEWYLGMAGAAERALRGGGGKLDWVERLERERDNLRAALGWARDNDRVELGLALAGRLWRFWERRGHVSEGLAWLDDLLSRDGDVSLDVRARALNAAGNLSRWVDSRTRAARYAASLALYRRLGDRDGIGRLLNNLGMVAQDQHDFQAAVTLYEESLAIFRSLGDDYSVAMCLANFGASASKLGDLGRAELMFEESNAIRRRLQDSLGLARSLMGHGTVLARMGAHERAEALMTESLELCRALGDHATLALVLSHRAEAAHAAGQEERARADFAGALVLAQRTGAPRLAAACIEGLATLAATRPPLVAAARLYGAADTIRERCGVPHPPADELRRATVGATLLDGAVNRAWAEGRSFTLAHAVEHALAWSRSV